MWLRQKVCIFARLVAKLTRPEAAKGPLRSSSQAATCYYNNSPTTQR